MQIIIDIPDHLYNVIKNKQCTMANLLTKAVENGTPLPKGHGDLKDMDDIYEALEGWDDDTSWIVDAIDEQAPTIIEADTSL